MDVQTTGEVSSEAMEAAALVPQRIMTAWKDQDAGAFSMIFAEDGVMILPGVTMKGRRDIEAFMSQAFAGPYRGTQVRGTPTDVRFVSKDVAILTTVGGVHQSPQADLRPEEEVVATWVLILRDGTWELTNYQNSPKNQ